MQEALILENNFTLCQKLRPDETVILWLNVSLAGIVQCVLGIVFRTAVWLTASSQLCIVYSSLGYKTFWLS